MRYHVYFDVDSSELDKVVKSSGEPPKHQGNALATWVRENLNAKWDVMQALYWKKLAVRVEARASATAKGLSHAKLLRYNQALSKKRLDAVVGRLKKTIEEKDKYIVLDTTQMKAIGASEAPKFGVEDESERRCVIASTQAISRRLSPKFISESSEEPAWQNFEAAWVRNRSPKRFNRRSNQRLLLEARWGWHGSRVF